MKTHTNESRMLWMLCGLVGGLCIAYFWPHEELRASATDHADKFAICTVETQPTMPEAVFVLNFVTGELKGAMLNQQTGIFTNFWIANVATDFKIKGAGKYAMIPGQAFLNPNPNVQAGGAVASGVIYIAEMTSGLVGCYRFHTLNAVAPLPPQQLEPVASFPFMNERKSP